MSGSSNSLTNEKQLPPLGQDATPKFGSMETVKPRRIHRTKIWDGFVKSGADAGSTLSGYHRRSLSETTMFRLKTIFGGKLRRRGFDAQAVELFLQCAALNCTIQLGKPDSYKVEN